MLSSWQVFSDRLRKGLKLHHCLPVVIPDMSVDVFSDMSFFYPRPRLHLREPVVIPDIWYVFLIRSCCCGVVNINKLCLSFFVMRENTVLQMSCVSGDDL